MTQTGGEFTSLAREEVAGNHNRESVLVNQACDRLDAQAKEIEELKTINKEDFKAIDMLGSEIHRLQKENAKLKEQLANRECVADGQGCCGYSQETMNALVAERDALKAENATLTERIAELEKHVDALKSVCENYIPTERLDQANDEVILLCEGIREEGGRAMLKQHPLKGEKP